MKQMLKPLAIVAAVVALIAATPAAADPRENANERITITGSVSATPAAGAAEVAIAVNTSPQTKKKHFAAEIKGTVIIVTLAAGTSVMRNGDAIPIGQLHAGDKVTITLSSRTGTAAPYKYVATKFIAGNAGVNYPIALSGVIATAPAEAATSIMVFVKSYTTTRFMPSTNLRNTTIQVTAAPGATILRNGIATPLGGLKLDDRVTITITERIGTAAPYSYLSNRIIATSAYSTQPVTVTGSIAQAPVAGALSVFIYVKNVAYDVGWANDSLKGTTIQVSPAPGGLVTRNGEATTLANLRLDDRVTLTLTERVGTAAPYLYLASRITATAYTSFPFTVSAVLASMPDASTTQVMAYVKSVVENDEHNAYANSLRGTVIIVRPTAVATITRDGATTTLAGLRLNDTLTITISERLGTTEPFTWSTNRIIAAS